MLLLDKHVEQFIPLEQLQISLLGGIETGNQKIHSIPLFIRIFSQIVLIIGENLLVLDMERK